MEKRAFPVILKNISFSYEEGKPLFKDMSLDLPQGVVSLVGQNGTGKSTLLLLAGGRLLPEKGTVEILGRNSSELASEEERNSLVSFIYQNMEFETEETIGQLLSTIYEGGFHKKKDPSLLKTIIDVLELGSLLDKRTGEISKGEMQRTVIAFSILYGSSIIMMDEPVFALENNRKEVVLAYLNEYAAQYGVTIYYSIHEIDLSRKYSTSALLFTKEGQILSGPTREIMSKENLEKAYQVPMDMLYQRENLYRSHLLEDGLPKGLSGINTKVIE
ncbi:ABC transporter ATP-binding protein [Spirochaeta isovalerica]|uniref:ABC-type cobalamin/Fe3+-siderophores transport system ATPase subunit n=1 Tax=Spirochaeta isovalerica TaxID=150 RepID=A0A841R7E5_9SPIO|nr:ABC transporter ATP-binding protein [Spirochaeta isovalerica]MBB6478899.1 ABC-type cobalamin/Fe3+-siderophores transport system ATPase subunit [Spirochaeta isovalerica]